MTPEQYRLQCLLYVNGVASQRESAREMLLACGPAAIPWIITIAEEKLKEFYKPGIGYPPFQPLIRYAQLLSEYGEPCCLDLLVRIAQQSPDQGYEEFRKPLKKLLTFLEARDDIETITALVAALRRLRRAILYQREAVLVAEILVASAERAPWVELHQVRALLQPSIGTPKEFRILSERLTRALGEENFLPLSAASAPTSQSLPIPVRAREENDG